MFLTVIAVLVLSLVSGLTTLIGAALAVGLKKRSGAVAVGLGFAAGIMLWVSCLELIPESYRVAGTVKASSSFFLGVSLMALLNSLIPHTHLCEEEGRPNPRLKTAYLCAFGLILHDFPEGFALANSYLHSPSLGLLIALSIALHNIPEEFAIAVPAVLANKGPGFLFKMAFLSGLAEPAGAVIGLLATSVMPGLTPAFLSFAAGAMVFISLHELVPTARLYGRKSLVVCGLVASFLVYTGLTFLIPESL